jgi:hypothetical protein
MLLKRYATDLGPEWPEDYPKHGGWRVGLRTNARKKGSRQSQKPAVMAGVISLIAVLSATLQFDSTGCTELIKSPDRRDLTFNE